MKLIIKKRKIVFSVKNTLLIFDYTYMNSLEIKHIYFIFNNSGKNNDKQL
jgi:hypothetical protein